MTHKYTKNNDNYLVLIDKEIKIMTQEEFNNFAKFIKLETNDEIRKEILDIYLCLKKNFIKPLLWNDEGYFTGELIDGLPCGFGKFVGQKYEVEGEWKQGHVKKCKVLYKTRYTFRYNISKYTISKDLTIEKIYAISYEGDTIENTDYNIVNTDGYGKMIYNDGSYYEGLWTKSKWDGIGKLVLSNGIVCEGKWNNDDIDYNNFIITYPNGNKSECINNVCKLFYQNGSYYTTNNVTELLVMNKNVILLEPKKRFGKMVYNNGNEYTGYWNNDTYHGEGMLLLNKPDENGYSVYKGIWFNGERKGKFQVFKGVEYIDYDEVHYNLTIPNVKI